MIRTTSVDEKSPWFTGKYWPESSPKQLSYDDEKSMYDALFDNCADEPNFPALWFLDSWVSYKELLTMVDQFANGLASLGLQKGDVLALLLPNSIQFVVAYLAAVKLGIVMTPINPTYKPAELKHQIHLTKAKNLICLDALYSKLVAPVEEDLNLDHLITTNLVDLASGLSSVKKVLGKLLKKIPSAKVAHAIKFKSLFIKEPLAKRAEIKAKSDPAVYLMTGGTTGVPKAAVLTHTNQYANALQSIGAIGTQRESEDAPFIGPNTGNICVLPLFHSFAMSAILNFALVSKGFAVLFPKPPKALELCETIQKLPKANGYIYCAAEVLFQRLNDFEDLEKYDIISKLRFSVSGAGPLHKYVQDKFESRTSAYITEGYGLTEASPVVSVGIFFGKERTSGSIGLPYPGTEWRIFPTEHFEKGPINEFGIDATGELCVSGPQVMKEYLNDPKETSDTIKEYGGKTWLLTGDIGYMNEDGCIVIRDRKKQLIKFKGYSIFPKEIETMIGSYDEVTDVACAGIPDPGVGEFVKVWVTLEPDAQITEEELLERCRADMAHYKVPREIEFRESIPKSLVGKVMRRTLQEEELRR